MKLGLKLHSDTFYGGNVVCVPVYNFVDFATFHPIQSSLIVKCHLNPPFFFDTEVFKGPRLSNHKKILDMQTHFNPTETFQYAHFSSCHPLIWKKGVIKEEALRFLRTNSVRGNFEQLANRTLNKECVKEATL